jgi:hypothetical protein
MLHKRFTRLKQLHIGSKPGKTQSLTSLQNENKSKLLKKETYIYKKQNFKQISFEFFLSSTSEAFIFNVHLGNQKKNKKQKG